MQVHALLLADFVQAVEGKLYMIGGAWNVLNVQAFPATHGLGIGVAIDIDWNETNQRHHAQLLVEDADGMAFESPRVDIDFETGRPPGHPVGTDQRLVFGQTHPADKDVLHTFGEDFGRGVIQVTLHRRTHLRIREVGNLLCP